MNRETFSYNNDRMRLVEGGIFMLYEITKTNSIGLFHYFLNLGYQGTKQEFDKDLFNNDYSYQRTYVYESEGEILSFIQYGKNKSGEGTIRFFATKEGFKYAGKELLFRATSYFYIFHLDVYIESQNTSLDKFFNNLNNSNCDSLLNEFKIERKNVLQANLKGANL